MVVLILSLWLMFALCLSEAAEFLQLRVGPQVWEVNRSQQGATLPLASLLPAGSSAFLLGSQISLQYSGLEILDFVDESNGGILARFLSLCYTSDEIM